MNDLLAERKRMIDQMTNSANFQYVLSKGPAEKEDPILVKSQSQQKEVIAIEMAKYEDDYAKTQKTITNIQKGIDSMKSKISETSIAGNVLMVLGILLFLIIITLNSFTFVESLSPYLTITAFALLMINYLVKQFYITNMKIDIEALREKYDK